MIGCHFCAISDDRTQVIQQMFSPLAFSKSKPRIMQILFTCIQGAFGAAKVAIGLPSLDEYAVLQGTEKKVLSSASAKETQKNSPGSTVSGKNTLTYTGLFSAIKTSDLLNFVKDYYGDVLSQDVLNKLNMDRPKSSLSDQVKFSLQDTAAMDVNALVE